MSINSLDHLMRKSTDGSIYSTDWQFTTNRISVATRWNDVSSLNTAPGPVNTYSATNGALTWVDCNSSSTFAIPIGPDVDEAGGITKHVIYASALSAVAAAVPGVLMLVDLQGYWPGISVNTTSPQSLSGTPTLRYPNGEGLKMYPVVTSATGAGTPSLSISYTNQAGTPSRSLSHTITMPASIPVSTIYQASPSTTTVSAGPFLPLQGGDTGVSNVTSVTFSSTTSGVIALCLARPILTIPIAIASLLSEKDLVNQFTSLPRVRNGACLVWLYYTGAAAGANTNVYGTLEAVWG